MDRDVWLLYVLVGDVQVGMFGDVSLVDVRVGDVRVGDVWMGLFGWGCLAVRCLGGDIWHVDWLMSCKVMSQQ